MLADSVEIVCRLRRSPIYPNRRQGDGVYIMLSGIARLTCSNRKRQTVLLEVLGPGDVVGVPSMLQDRRSNLRCDAFTNCELGLIFTRSLVETVMKIPFDDFRVASELTLGVWWKMLVRQAHFVEQGLEERIAIALLDLSAKFGVPDSRGEILNVELSHSDLADLVMGSRPKVNRHLRALAEQGAIIRERRRIVVVRERLQAVVGAAPFARTAF
jgi:CRP/FNR family cyclic AMP-dependent transcriptional regulator